MANNLTRTQLERAQRGARREAERARLTIELREATIELADKADALLEAEAEFVIEARRASRKGVADAERAGLGERLRRELESWKDGLPNF